MNRRLLLQSIIKASPLVVWGTAPTAYSAANDLQVTALGDSLSLFSGAGSNVLVKKAANGDLLIVDGGLEANAERLLEGIRQAMGPGEITTLMNTHWHREQTGLNFVLGNAGTRIFAHENTRQWLSVELERPWEDLPFEPLPLAAQPNETFFHYGDIDHSGSIVQYGHMVQAHTDGDMYVYFPEENILHAGGVVSNEGYPLLDWWTGGWIGGLVDGLERLLNVGNRNTLIVPANGPVMTMAELSAMRDMYQTIFERIRSLFMAAQSAKDTLEARPTAEFDDRWGDSDLFVLLAHQSVLAHYAPDA